MAADYNYNRNQYYQNSYNASSFAYAYDYIEDEEEQLEQKRQQQKLQLQMIKDRKARRIHRLKFICAILYVFVSIVAMMVVNALVMEQRVKIKGLNANLIQLQNENVALEAEISEKIDLNYVQTEAINRLGMAEPQGYQVVYIDVPKQSYTIQYAVAEEDPVAVEAAEGEGFSLKSIVSLFTK